MFGLQFLIQRRRICLERMLRDIQYFHLHRALTECDLDHVADLHLI